MNRVVLAGAAAFAMLCGSVAAQAGGTSGGGPVIDPGDPDPGADPTDPDAGGGTGTGGTGTGTGGTTAAVIPYTYGSGAKLFTLDSLPTGPSGTQAYFQPAQDNSSLSLPNLPSAQGVLHETVGGTTVSFHTDTFVLGSGNPIAEFRTDTDGSLFGYLGVPTAVGVGILATGNALIYANFTDQLSYFSINLYRLSGAFDVNTTITAYSGLDGLGTVLGTTSGSITGGNNFAFTTVQLANLAGARSFKIQGNSFLANYDDITVTGVPEASSWTMFIGGFGLIGGTLRRRRAATAFA